MKIVAVFAVCAVLVGVACATPLPEDSTIAQLVNKVLSQSAELQKQEQDANEQNNMAMLQDVFKDETKKQHDVKEQTVIRRLPRKWCSCSTWG